MSGVTLTRSSLTTRCSVAAAGAGAPRALLGVGSLQRLTLQRSVVGGRLVGGRKQPPKSIGAASGRHEPGETEGEVFGEVGGEAAMAWSEETAVRDFGQPLAAALRLVSVVRSTVKQSSVFSSIKCHRSSSGVSG